MKALENLDGSDFKRAQTLALKTYRLKDPEYGSSWKKSLRTWGWDFVAMRLQEDVARLVSLVQSRTLRAASVKDTLTDIQVYAIFGLMFLDSAEGHPRKDRPKKQHKHRQRKRT